MTTQTYNLVPQSLKNWDDQNGHWIEGLYDLLHGSSITSSGLTRGSQFPNDTSFQITYTKRVEVPGKGLKRYQVRAFRQRVVNEDGLDLREYSSRVGFRSKQWSGSKTYRVPVGSITSVLGSVLDKEWTLGGLPTMQSIQISALLKDPNDPNYALLTIGYQSPLISRSHPSPGEMTISIQSKPVVMKLDEDIDGNIIQGVSPIDPLVNYKVIRGEDQGATHYLAEIILRTSRSQDEIDWGTIGSLMNRVNSDQITALNISSGHLKCVNAGVPKFFVHESPIDPVPLVYQFLYNPILWNEWTRSESTTPVVRQVPVIHSTIKMSDYITAYKNKAENTYPLGNWYLQVDGTVGGIVAADADPKFRQIVEDVRIDTHSRKLYYTTNMNYIFEEITSPLGKGILQ